MTCDAYRRIMSTHGFDIHTHILYIYIIYMDAKLSSVIYHVIPRLHLSFVLGSLCADVFGKLWSKQVQCLALEMPNVIVEHQIDQMGRTDQRTL